MQISNSFEVGIKFAAREQLICANSLETLRILFITLEAMPRFTL